MTVSYMLDVSHTSILGFLKLQLRWRGSVWKCVLKELLMFTFTFSIITAVYRTPGVLNKEQREFWDNFSALFDEKMDYIPLTFMLGFFVTIIVGRWNEIFNNIGWVDSTALTMSTYLRGSDDKSRMIRRNVIRYMVLTQVMIFRDISMQVRKRFPTLDTIVAAGYMSEDECRKYNEASVSLKYSRYFLPIQWSFSILYEARGSGKIGCDLMLNEIIKHIQDFRIGLARLSNFDWVPIPLVYPQVVFLAVRAYFFLCLIARQSVTIDGKVPEDGSPIYPFVPFLMTALQFIFYIGWMKVAESLMNPMGEDDDDFECNFLVDRNLSVGLALVDDLYGDIPQQTKDVFWSERSVEPLYSADTANKPIFPQVGSAAQYDPDVDEVVMMPHMAAGAEEDGEDGDLESDRLLPRGVSIVSVNRGSRTALGSRASLASRSNRGFIDSIKSKFKGDRNDIAKMNFSSMSRPHNLGMSKQSLNERPTIEVIGGSSIDLMQHNVEHETRGELLTPDTDLSPMTPTRRSPLAPMELTSVPEEDEENQRTRGSVDLRKWRQQQREQEERERREKEEKEKEEREGKDGKEQ